MCAIRLHLLVDAVQAPYGLAVLSALILNNAHRSLDNGQGIVNFVCHPGRHLPHRGEPFALNELLLHLLQAAIGLLKAVLLLGQAR